jgi:tRNA 2-thiouridine synthesizing protein A
LDETLLDLRGLKCPLPALHTRRALARLPQGARLRVLASDPMSVIDVPHAVAQAQGRLLSQASEEGVFSFEIERLAATP